MSLDLNENYSCTDAHVPTHFCVWQIIVTNGVGRFCQFVDDRYSVSLDSSLNTSQLHLFPVLFWTIMNSIKLWLLKRNEKKEKSLIQFTMPSMLKSEYVLDQFTMPSMLNPDKEFCWTWMLNSEKKGEVVDSGSGEAGAIRIWILQCTKNSIRSRQKCMQDSNWSGFWAQQ
jgi:hypothetical protein